MSLETLHTIACPGAELRAGEQLLISAEPCARCAVPPPTAPEGPSQWTQERRGLRLVPEDTPEAVNARLRAEYPELKPVAKGQRSATVAAANVRRALARRFPGVKFSVRTRYASMMSAIDVEWTDGPLTVEVEPFVDRHCYEEFDPVQDLGTIRRDGRAFRDLFGSARFTSAERRYSDAAIEYAITQVSAHYNAAPVTVADYKAGNLWQATPTGDHNDAWPRSIRDFLERRQAFAPLEVAS